MNRLRALLADSHREQASAISAASAGSASRGIWRGQVRVSQRDAPRTRQGRRFFVAIEGGVETPHSYWG